MIYIQILKIKRTRSSFIECTEDISYCQRTKNFFESVNKFLTPRSQISKDHGHDYLKSLDTFGKFSA